MREKTKDKITGTVASFVLWIIGAWLYIVAFKIDNDFDFFGGAIYVIRPGTRGGDDEYLACVHVGQDDLIWPSLRINKFRMGNFSGTTDWTRKS